MAGYPAASRANDASLRVTGPGYRAWLPGGRRAGAGRGYRAGAGPGTGFTGVEHEAAERQ